ncbi:MAG: hypothetical protein IPJ41_16400 [Phycisphaerales bacterium]|nr:hypothetical protein [Phycisphaerales bacterium]
MASVTTLPDGKRRVQFISPGGARKTVHLGKVEKRYADAVCTRVESILGAQIRGEPRPGHLAWLGRSTTGCTRSSRPWGSPRAASAGRWASG